MIDLKNLSSMLGTGLPQDAPAPAAPKAKAGFPASLKAAHAAHKAGDHAGAKRHAFAAIKALPGKAIPAV